MVTAFGAGFLSLQGPFSADICCRDRCLPVLTGTNEETRTEANELLNKVINYAFRMLRRFGEFGPFAFSMKQDGSIVMEPGFQDGPPDPALMLNLLTTGLAEKAQKGRIRAAATAANITLRQPSDEGYSDGVMVDIEHQSGYCVEAFIPYKMAGGQLHGLIPRRVVLGKLKAVDQPGKLFGKS